MPDKKTTLERAEELEGKLIDFTLDYLDTRQYKGLVSENYAKIILEERLKMPELTEKNASIYLEILENLHIEIEEHVETNKKMKEVLSELDYKNYLNDYFLTSGKISGFRKCAILLEDIFLNTNLMSDEEYAKYEDEIENTDGLAEDLFKELVAKKFSLIEQKELEEEQKKQEKLEEERKYNEYKKYRAEQKKEEEEKEEVPKMKEEFQTQEVTEDISTAEEDIEEQIEFNNKRKLEEETLEELEISLKEDKITLNEISIKWQKEYEERKKLGNTTVEEEQQKFEKFSSFYYNIECNMRDRKEKIEKKKNIDSSSNIS